MLEEHEVFIRIPIVGDLIVEYIVFEGSYPIMFTCRDKVNNLYLCICVENREEQRWIVSQITIKSMLDMLCDKVTMYNSFVNELDNIYVIKWKRGQIDVTIDKVKVSEVDKLDLPDKDEYIDIVDGEFSDYIVILEREL